ncbi:MAG: bifunctional hydroxymethylpyrimidine kinase/phosphomethylpyrimidine kinase [Geminicoccaceae bacterium]
MSDERPTQTERIANVLTIAGSDSGGGAGIQADLKAISAMGVYGLSVITALTAQNTRAVTAIHDVPPDMIAAQLDAVFDDIRIDAVKIGMLSRPEVIEVVADRLRRYDARKIVLDPVMVAKSGDVLLQPDAVSALIEHLVPLAWVITPNLPEAGVLLGRLARADVDGMRQVAADLRALGPTSVLLKGGHLTDGEAVDIFDFGKKSEELRHARVPTKNTHGTGCTLSATMAALLGQGLDLPAAVRLAKASVAQMIAAADQLDVGKGHGPVHHFYDLWSCFDDATDEGAGR